ncbi:hypothetical protein [Terrisporobacter sp.]|uniref:hypothetical protein n=1 Tax=Terrisporobacter sp. TaxID=1965305 RepID=UPI00289CD69D|nr:hypothetical protein [Terrisporobacter sp.]
MSKLFKAVNGSIHKQGKRYVKEIKANSSYFEVGNKPCKTKKDNHTMITRDIATINEDEVNDRQKGLKVDLILFTSFYIMLIYLCFNMLL